MSLSPFKETSTKSILKERTSKPLKYDESPEWSPTESLQQSLHNMSLNNTNNDECNNNISGDANINLWKACKMLDNQACIEALQAGANPNTTENGIYLLCMSCHLGNLQIVHTLLEGGADPNVFNNPSLTLTSSSSTSTVDLSQSNKSVTQLPSRRSTPTPESPLTIAIKFNHSDIIKLLIDYGADALYNGEFDKSPLQDAIRLYRVDCLKYMCQVLPNMNQVLEKFKKEVIRQCLVNDNLEALTMFIEILWNDMGINSDLFIVILNNLMLKNKVQSDKTADTMHLIMESIPVAQVKIYDLSILIKFFLRLMSAQFLSISDERIKLLLYRANLFFIILKYLDKFDFSPFLSDLDFAFMTIYDSVKDTGESKAQVFDFMINFYDNLIIMGYLRLTSNIINQLTSYRHVMELRCIQNYLLSRATTPMKLKEQCRLAIKQALDSFKYSRVFAITKLDEPLREYVHFLR